MAFSVFSHNTNDKVDKSLCPNGLNNPPFTFTIVGKRNSGKTNLIKSLTFEKYNNYFKQVLLMSGTQTTINEFKEIHKQLNPDFEMILKHNYDEEYLRKMIEERENKISKGERLEPMLVILDDLATYNVSKKQTTNSIDTLFYNGRHVKIDGVIITTQKYTQLNQSTRGNNITSLFLHRMMPKDLKQVYDEVANQIIDSYQEFKRIYRENVVDIPYGFIILDLVENVVLNNELKEIEVSDEDSSEEEVLKPQSMIQTETPKVRRVVMEENQYYLELTNNTKIPISENKLKVLCEKLIST